MKNIFLFGWFGEKNLGDDVLLKQTLDTIYEIDKDCQCTILTNNFSNIRINNKKTYNIKFIDKSIKSLLKCINDYDLYIFGPGGLFPNRDLKKLLFMYCYIKILKIKKKNVVIWGLGIENCNFKNKLNRFFMKGIINSVDECTLRYNYEIYNEQKKHIKNAKRTADIMFLHDYTNFTNNLQGKYISIALANIFHNDLERNDFIESIKPTLLRAINDGYQLHFLTFTNKKDYDLNEMVIKSLNLNKKDYINMDYTDEIDMILEDINNSDFIIGMRFHSLVFSCNLVKPFISLSYSSKNEELLEDFNVSELSLKICYDLDKYFCKKITINPKKLEEKYHYVKNNKNIISDKIKQNLKKERDLSKININVLKKFI